MKQCTKCKQLKPEINFWADRHLQSGLKSACIECLEAWRKKFYTNKHALKVRRKAQERYNRNPKNKLKRRVRDAVKQAIISGLIKRPKFCSQCGAPRPEAHHHNGYEEPFIFNVQWLCRSCHGVK
jgi:hypothetical protein